MKVHHATCVRARLYGLLAPSGGSGGCESRIISPVLASQMKNNSASRNSTA